MYINYKYFAVLYKLTASYDSLSLNTLYRPESRGQFYQKLFYHSHISAALLRKT